jgi:hypothetical protein
VIDPRKLRWFPLYLAFCVAMGLAILAAIVCYHHHP